LLRSLSPTSYHKLNTPYLKEEKDNSSDILYVIILEEDKTCDQRDQHLSGKIRLVISVICIQEDDKACDLHPRGKIRLVISIQEDDKACDRHPGGR
jgi:hypothetical protein